MYFLGLMNFIQGMDSSKIWELGAQNLQLVNFGVSYFLRQNTIYSDYNHEYVFTY